MPGNQIIGVHIHILLAGLVELGELLPQLFFIFHIVALGFIKPVKLAYNIVNDILLGLQYLGKIGLQRRDQLVLVHGNTVGAAIRSLPIVAAAHPPDIGVFIGTDGAPERPTTFFAFD